MILGSSKVNNIVHCKLNAWVLAVSSQFSTVKYMVLHLSFLAKFLGFYV